MNTITMQLNADELILQALREDITSEDITTNAVMPEKKLGRVELICKQDGVIAGLDVFARVFSLLDPATEITFFCKDGDEVKNGQKMAVLTGDIRILLSGERVALNYLQRMSGIATYTKSIAKLLEGTKTKLLDTRKTTPNMRVFEKYAVKVGGGYNHRYNLSDGVLLKDNHIGAAGSVTKAVQMAKEYAPFVRKIEIEVENLDMVKEAVEIVVEESTRIKDRNPDAVKAVTEALVLSGIAMSFVGNSRPASGSEHHLSHYWEMKFQAEGKKPILHGIKVGIGMIAVTKMYETLENEQFDFASLKERSFDYAAWEKKVKDCYQDAAPGIIALEEKAQKNNLDKRNKRLAILEEKWPKILRTIKESLPSSAEMEKLLASLGAPINPAQIGVSSELVEDAVILAKEVRDRFTLLQVLWDTGLLDEYAKMIAAYFGEKANC